MKNKHTDKRLKIAVVGSGISGLVCARGLAQTHEVTLFELGDRLGGHTHTVRVVEEGVQLGIDTGFIVFNDWTYPHFIALMNTLGVKSKPSDMGFGVKCDQTGIEYQGRNLDTLFAQRKNLLSYPHIRMLLEILRFNRESIAYIELHPHTEIPLGEFLNLNSYSSRFQSHYILPMGAAIWSASKDQMLQFPLKFFVSFFKNHGMLSVNDRPIWRVLEGGSSSYLKEILKDRTVTVRLNTRIESIRRFEHEVLIRVASPSQSLEKFDQVVLACHSDQAMDLLEDVTPREREILSEIPYQNNETVLHTDTSKLPKNKKAWAAWNYKVNQDPQSPVSVTYNMNILQGIQSKKTYLVSLNMTPEIDPSKIILKQQYTHPVYKLSSPKAQGRWSEISGTSQRTHFAGAYWRSGFHEDGVWSGLRVLGSFGIILDEMPAQALKDLGGVVT